MIARLVAVLMVGVTLSSCNQKPADKPFNAAVVLSLKGDCKEDHANVSARYVGFLAKYPAGPRDALRSYGFVMRPDFAKQAMEEAKNPTEYQAPQIIRFLNITFDPSQDDQILHGVSDSRDSSDDDDSGSSGYAATCSLKVTARSKTIPDISKLISNLN